MIYCPNHSGHPQMTIEICRARIAKGDQRCRKRKKVKGRKAHYICPIAGDLITEINNQRKEHKKMALPEVCAVWIEQRVQEEMEDGGKSLRQIGRIVAAEVEKYFEARVNPETIRKRAERSRGTNVPPTTTTGDDGEIPENQTIKQPAKDGTMRGGSRSGAGRKPKSTPQPEGRCTVSDAMGFAIMAISQLKRIQEDDPKWREAFDKVVGWINEETLRRGQNEQKNIRHKKL